VRAQPVERLLLGLLTLVILVWTLLPILHIFVISITPPREAFLGRLWPAEPTLANYATVLTQDDYYLSHIWLQFGNSLFIAVMSCALVLALATTVSFAVSRLKVKFGWVVTNLALLTYLIPAAFLAIPFYKVMATYGLLNTTWSLIIAMVIIASPYAIWVLRQYSDSIPPELDEAARIDGATPLQIFLLVYLPLVTPALVATGSFAFLHAWNEYLYAFLLLSSETVQTVPVSLSYFLRVDEPVWPVVMAISMLYSLPPVALYYFTRRFMVSGMTAGAVK